MGHNALTSFFVLGNNVLSKYKEKAMVNKKFRLGMLVMVLVFGMVVVGCDNGSTNGLNNGPDIGRSLNGTWVFSSQTPGAVLIMPELPDEWSFNNGTFEHCLGVILIVRKGAYTASDGRITIVTTHLHGDNHQSFRDYDFADFGLESRWYSRSEMEAAIRVLGKWTDRVEEDVNSAFSTWPLIPFSVDGDTLNLGGRIYSRTE